MAKQETMTLSYAPIVLKVFKRLLTHLKKNSHALAFFDASTNLKTLVDEQQTLFLRMFFKSPQEIHDAYAYLTATYYHQGIALVDLIEVLHYLRRAIYRALLKKELLSKHFLECNQFFLHVQQGMAKGYLLEEIQEKETFYQHEFNQVFFYKVHLKWMLSLLHSIKHTNTKKSVNLDIQKCNFTQLLDMPITDMILRANGDKEYIFNIIEKMHLCARSLVNYAQRKAYYESYMHLKSITNYSMEIMHFLNKKIIHHYGSMEESFIQYVKYQSEKNVRGYLSCLNISKLKLINKYKGDDIGDQLLDYVESMLKAFFVALDEDVVYVRGKSGDFLIFYPNIKRAYLEKIQTQLRLLIQIEGVTLSDEIIYPQFSIGTLPLHTEGIFNHLDKMLTYVSDQARDNENKVFYAKREEEAHTIELIEKSHQDINFVEHALNKEKLEIFFQPIIDLSTGKLFDVEVLARIKNGNTFITAGAFINLIYELDIVVDLDIGILRKIIAYAPKIVEVTNNVFINISPSSLKSTRYREILTASVQTLREIGIQPFFELTEEALLHNIDLIETIHAQHGIVFAVDDFGTGYSSLKTVADLAEKKVIAFIKIDGSIIRNVLNSKETLNILDATNYMTKKLNLKNVAEFIENEQILDKVKELGIHYGQGHYFSQALSLEELQAKYLP